MRNKPGYSPGSLPNRDGFEFIGESKKTGEFAKCKVKKCPITELHFVSSGLPFSEIFAWYTVEQYRNFRI